MAPVTPAPESDATACTSDMMFCSAAVPNAAASRWVSTRNNVLTPWGMVTGPLEAAGIELGYWTGPQVGDVDPARRLARNRYGCEL